jgi:aspartate/methionine/tyrosine aminotransferase
MKLPPFQLERFFAEHEFNARFLLSSSDCEAWTIDEILALQPGAEKDFKELWLGYTQSTGSPTLRAEIAGIYRQTGADQVLVHAGASEAIWTYMNAVLAAGDHVIVQTPCYQSLFEVPLQIGCEVTPWRMTYADRWDLHIADLEASIRPDTKLVVMNSPHNPTGFQMSRSFQKDAIELARRCGSRVFFDEVYRELEYRESDRLPAGCDLYDLAASLGVLSKTYGLPGLRIGWVATQDARAFQAMNALKDYTSMCNSAPSEFLAEVALRRRNTLAQRNSRIIRENLAHLDSFFARHAETLEWQRPLAGPIALPRLRLHADDEKFCAEVIRLASVMVVPGTLFGSPGHVRIGFGRRNLPEALEAFETAIMVI